MTIIIKNRRALGVHCGFLSFPPFFSALSVLSAVNGFLMLDFAKTA